MSRRKRYTRNLGRRLSEPLPVRATTEWVRFEHEVEPYGVFSYLDETRARTDNHDRDEIDAIYAWFADHLGAPELMERARFWFKAEATEYVVRGRRLMELAVGAGIPIVERRTRRIPGKVRFQDDKQVAVHAYRDTPKARRGTGGDH
jgi:hypothetical protein